MANFPVPKGYQRMGAFPLDGSTVFTTLAELTTYASTNGTAYVGQICSVVAAGVVTVYKINTDLSVTAIDSGASTDFGEFV